MGDLVRGVETVETKALGLARTMPTTVYEWRPAKGVRSTGEILVHIAGDNYSLPALMGVTAPPETGIDGRDHVPRNSFVQRIGCRSWLLSLVYEC